MFNVTDYVVLVFFCLALLSHGCYSLWKIKKHLHILQLNSYVNGRYFVWLKQRVSQVFCFRELAPLLALIGMLFQVQLVILVLFVILYLRLFLLRSRLPEKKPLVFTARAKRLFSANVIFLLGIYLLLFWLWWSRGDIWLVIMLVLLVGYNFFLPIFLLLGNFIILPLEKLIQAWYFFDAYKLRRKMSNLKVIGITGSFGKTTTKYILTNILQQKFATLMTPGSYNTTMGVTKVMRAELKPQHDIFVAELSAKKPGDIQEICRLVHPQYGILTAIGEQHLETFKTLANIKNTKNELIQALPTDGIICCNVDDVNCRELAAAAKCRVIRYCITATEEQPDYYAIGLKTQAYGSSFTVVRARDNLQEVFQTKLLGRHNVSNILGAIALAAELGMELHSMVYPVRQLAAVPHRLELRRVRHGVVFIDDSFNSNPVGSKMAVEVLGQLPGKRKIIVTPGMIELGVKENEYNKRLGEYIAEVCDYVILIGKKQTAAIQEGLWAKNYAPKSCFIAADFGTAKLHLERTLKAGDVVLFENDLPDNYSEFFN